MFQDLGFEYYIVAESFETSVPWDRYEAFSFRIKYEPPCGKTNNVVSEQVHHKPGCAVREKS